MSGVSNLQAKHNKDTFEKDMWNIILYDLKTYYYNKIIVIILVFLQTNKSIKYSREYKVDYAYVVIGVIEKDLRAIQQRKKSQSISK